MGSKIKKYEKDQVKRVTKGKSVMFADSINSKRSERNNSIKHEKDIGDQKNQEYNERKSFGDLTYQTWKTGG